MLKELPTLRPREADCRPLGVRAMRVCSRWIVSFVVLAMAVPGVLLVPRATASPPIPPSPQGIIEDRYGYTQASLFGVASPENFIDTDLPIMPVELPPSLSIPPPVPWFRDDTLPDCQTSQLFQVRGQFQYTPFLTSLP